MLIAETDIRYIIVKKRTTELWTPDNSSNNSLLEPKPSSCLFHHNNISAT